MSREYLFVNGPKHGTLAAVERFPVVVLETAGNPSTWRSAAPLDEAIEVRQTNYNLGAYVADGHVLHFLAPGVDPPSNDELLSAIVIATCPKTESWYT